MKIELVTEENFKDSWDNFVIKNSSPSSFLQSWEWGNFREKKLNEKIFRYAIYQDDELISVALLVKRALPQKTFYLNCAKGPIIKFPIFNPERSGQLPNKSQILNFKFQKKILKLIANEIKKIRQQEKIIFFRIAPPYQKNINLKIKKNNLQPPAILTNLKEPDNTLVLNLEKNAEELLKSMHPKTRYNLRLAQKKGVRVRISNLKTEDLDIFYNLSRQTAQRDKINIFNKEYYKNLLTDCTLPTVLLIAEHQQQPLASIIVLGFGDTATYFYGASANEKRNLMPSYLIQWAAIIWAKKQGYKYYDFWGIKENQSATNKNNWSGITRFKKGFVAEATGQKINYLGTFDYVLNKKWYHLFKIGKIIRNFYGFTKNKN